MTSKQAPAESRKALTSKQRAAIGEAFPFAYSVVWPTDETPKHLVIGTIGATDYAIGYTTEGKAFARCLMGELAGVVYEARALEDVAQVVAHDTSDARFARAERLFANRGTQAGETAASWVADGNTSEEELKALYSAMIGCEWDYSAPTLSGEWAGDSTPQSLREEEIGNLLTDDEFNDGFNELCEAWEEAASLAYQQEAERVVIGLLSDSVAESVREEAQA